MEPRLENKRARLSPRNGVEAETYQAYDWLKTANSAASMGQIAIAKENLVHARDSIIRAIAKADAEMKPKPKLGKLQQEFIKILYRVGSWRYQGIGGWSVNSMSDTQRIADSLEKRKLVKKRKNPSMFGKHVYVLTNEGKMVARSLS